MAGGATEAPDRSAETALDSFGSQIGLAFGCSMTSLMWRGPPERTGKARGTDLRDGTVTLPLIAAVALEPDIGEVDLRALDRESVEVLCDRIATSGALEQVRSDAPLVAIRSQSTGALSRSKARRSPSPITVAQVQQRR